MAVIDELLGPPARPTWFDESITRVLDDADVVTSARGPLELEQLTVGLLGAELHRAVHEEPSGLLLGWWFAELVEAATGRAMRADGASWEPPFWLLHGLAGVAPPSLQPNLTALSRSVRSMRGDGAARPPGWLSDVPRVAATGEVLRMRDAYGSRFAVIAGFSYPGVRNSSVFLFDIDASGFVTLVDAGIFDDPERAATAWRARVGDAARHARPEPVVDADELLCLVLCDIGDEHVIRGDESRPVMDNWFRAQRRVHDLGRALHARGTPLPAPASLFGDVETAVMTGQFTAWYADAHDTAEPDPEAVEALAYEWMEGTLPETWYAASPRRVEFQLDLIGDWVPDDPVTIAVRALLPEWVRWLGERAGLPEPLRQRALTAASAQ